MVTDISRPDLCEKSTIIIIIIIIIQRMVTILY